MIFFPRYHHESWICLCSLCFIPHHVWLLPAQVMHSMFVGFTVRWCVCTRGWSGCYNQCRVLKHGEPVRISRRGCRWSLLRLHPGQNMTGGEDRSLWSCRWSLCCFFVFFFTAMWFQFCLFPSDSAAVQSHPRRTLMVKLVKNMAN